jgi:tetratricopeptide (TPR) repeat protein
MRATVPDRSIIVLLAAITILTAGCADKSLKYYNLGVSAAEREDYERAVEHWRESIKFRSSDPDTRYNLGLALLKLERYGEAESEFMEALKYAPYDHEIHYGIGQALEMQGELVEAKKSYERSINLKPNFVPSLVGLASLSAKNAQYRSAEKYATTVVQIEPSNIEGNLLLSEAYFNLGNFREAFAQLQSAKIFAPQNPNLHLWLGKVMYARHMYGDALEELTKARSLGISNAEVYVYLGLTLLNLESYRDAETYFKLAVFKNRDDKRAWQGLGTIYTKSKEWSKALDAFNNALSIDPDDGESILGVAFVMMNLGRLADAIERLEMLTSRSEPQAMPFYYLGHSYMRSERYEEAGAAFRTFMNMWRGDKRLLEEVASILEALGD